MYRRSQWRKKNVKKRDIRRYPLYPIASTIGFNMGSYGEANVKPIHRRLKVSPKMMEASKKRGMRGGGGIMCCSDTYVRPVADDPSRKKYQGIFGSFRKVFSWITF